MGGGWKERGGEGKGRRRDERAGREGKKEKERKRRMNE